MKTLIIISKPGRIGLRYILVDGDQTKYNGLFVNKGEPLSFEFCDMIKNKFEDNSLNIIEELSEVYENYDKTALVSYIN
jgi:hypothetical protein